MSRIEMWFDGGGAYGIGNVLRSRELGARIAARGHAVKLRALSPLAAQLAGSPAAEVATRPDAVVLDLPYAGDAVLAAARAQGARVLALDYEGKDAPDHVISLQAVRPLPTGTPHSVGFPFAIVRSEFLRLREQPVPRSDEVLVILGGGDAQALTDRAITLLAGKLPHLTVVLGPAAAAPPAAWQAAGVQCIAQPTDLARRMASCRWAVCTGGTTMLELLCLGTPAHVLPRTAAEQSFAERAQHAGAVLGVGLDTLAASAAGLHRDCAARAAHLIDGRGCERIAEQLEALLALEVCT